MDSRQAADSMLAGVLDPDSPVNITGKFIILVTLGSREMLKNSPIAQLLSIKE